MKMADSDGGDFVIYIDWDFGMIKEYLKENKIVLYVFLLIFLFC